MDLLKLQFTLSNSIPLVSERQDSFRETLSVHADSKFHIATKEDIVECNFLHLDMTHPFTILLTTPSVEDFVSDYALKKPHHVYS